MTIIEREQQILRVSQQGVHNSLDQALATQLKPKSVRRLMHLSWRIMMISTIASMVLL
jgi:hypothetical protein